MQTRNNMKNIETQLIMTYMCEERGETVEEEWKHT
jgi:hypothetical protein